MQLILVADRGTLGPPIQTYPSRRTYLALRERDAETPEEAGADPVWWAPVAGEVLAQDQAVS